MSDFAREKGRCVTAAAALTVLESTGTASVGACLVHLGGTPRSLLFPVTKVDLSDQEVALTLGDDSTPSDKCLTPSKLYNALKKAGPGALLTCAPYGGASSVQGDYAVKFDVTRDGECVLIRCETFTL